MTADHRERVLVLTPSGRDAEVAAALLSDAGLLPHVCADIGDVVRGIREGAGAVLVAEEAIALQDASALTATLGEQEPWSDVPIIVITLPGSRSHEGGTGTFDVFGQAGNVTLIERPFRAATLASVAHAALRARRRQYQMRELLADVRRGEEQLRLAVRTGRLGVWRIDLPTREMQTSEICRTHYGRRPDQPLTHEALWRIIHPDDRERVRTQLQAVIDGAAADYDAEYRTVWPDGSVHWLLVRGQVARDGRGRPLSVGGVSLDITDRKVAEERREQTLDAERAARAEAERLGRMKDEFLATLSHELRTPLNAILGWAQLLNRGSVAEGQREQALRTIERNARIQAEMIEDLLDMSRIISGKLKLQPVPTDLAASVTAAADTVATAAEGKGVAIELDIDHDVEPIFADANRLQQVVWNLLNNAVKFTPPGGVVRASLRQRDGQATITVSDTGRGIEPAFLPYVFERFRQADGSTTRSFGGLGLGLSIVKQVVELHGGVVSVTSPGIGRGATFSVSLPVRGGRRDLLAYPEEKLHHRVHRPNVNGGGSPATNGDSMDERLDNLRVLLVDDDDDGRDLVFRVLAEVGAHVTPAPSAAEALRLVARQPFDVLVSDIGMPGQDGYALIAQVRGMERAAGTRLPAIALTAFARDSDRARAIEAGFDGHLSKPIDPGHLVASLRRLASGGAIGVSPAGASGVPSPPAPARAPTAIAPQTVSPEGQPGGAGSGGGGSGVPLNVLIVDDTKVVAEVLEQIFCALGHNATVAHSGQRALEIIGDRSSPAFDVIFSDISMPGMDGHQLASRLRDMRQRGELKAKMLVAMSGYSEPEEKERSLRSGFDRHVVKPPEVSDLEDLLMEVQGA